MSCFTACVRPKLDIISVDIISHRSSVSTHLQSSHPFRTHLTSTSFDRTSHPIMLPNLFFSEDIKVPSGTETSHNGFLMAKSSRHFGRLLSAQPWLPIRSNEKLTTNTSSRYYINCFTISGNSFSISQRYC